MSRLGTRRRRWRRCLLRRGAGGLRRRCAEQRARADGLTGVMRSGRAVHESWVQIRWGTHRRCNRTEYIIWFISTIYVLEILPQFIKISSNHKFSGVALDGASEGTSANRHKKVFSTTIWKRRCCHLEKGKMYVWGTSFTGMICMGCLHKWIICLKPSQPLKKKPGSFFCQCVSMRFGSAICLITERLINVMCYLLRHQVLDCICLCFLGSRWCQESDAPPILLWLHLQYHH